ncbi:MAG: DUF1842 domain-containing protein [Leptolyngbya sp. SIO1D8]|nr:DUF1842 domain-containing protein [Leptolyngbya sp. SIO1D8]
MSALDKAALFIVCYTIETDRIDAPAFSLNLTVNPPKETVHGLGKITQSTSPPLDITTRLDGSFTHMTVMPDNTHILVVATGYPVIHWPPYSGVGQVIPPNAELRMLLSRDWKSGTANYKYLDNQGDWHSMSDASVNYANCPVLT